MFLVGLALFLVVYIGACIGILMQASIIGGLDETKVLACALPIVMPISIIFATIHEKDIGILRLLVHMDALAIALLHEYKEFALKYRYQKRKRPIALRWGKPILESIDSVQAGLAH